ncbi:MAG: bifunctional phosphoribosyl-AMP cyclohydrolase/phosphoribosyl-ATP diphosphatase HisIE [Clostridia bacterium]|nr:bifunctional phosphoribosyl-AMP cyclohydrolase/phosphoribosyl-ATP diphosphatase HisIE [Clostridia bacterium]
MINVDKLKFDVNGLIPAVVQDAYTKKVLTVAYMNRESLEISIKRRLTCFYSRTRKSLWLKGETSGNFQHIVSITADCDLDSLTIQVVKDGPACHLGTDSCFTNDVYINPAYEDEKFPYAGDEDKEPAEEDFTYQGLYRLLQGRKDEKVEGSYTSYLFEKGKDKILKKVGEECTEVVIAAKGGDKAETVYEISDLAYHVMVLMVQEGISLNDIKKELASRHVVDKKVKQERMQ